MSIDIELRKFKMSDIKFDKEKAAGPVVVCIGKRGTGKTYLIKDLLFHHQDIPVGTVISGSEEGNGFYGKMVPRMFIHHEYSTAIVENVLRRQKNVLKDVKKQMEMFRRTTTDPRTFVILDDCMFDSSWTRDKWMRFIFMNGRHLKIMLILTMQYPLGIPPILRTNIDYTFILRDTIKSNRKRLWESFAGMVDSLDQFNQIMDQCTNDFECLVIDNTTKSNLLADQVFWYKADDHPDFKLGSREFWEASKDLPDLDDMFDSGRMASARRGPALHIKKKPH